jgi:alkylation response protein AidB-like acyl-CoA dehydrogenase
MTTSAAELAELRDAVRRALAAEPDAVPPIDREWREGWPALAGIGLLAFCAPEEVGGFGDEVPAALVVSRELGAALHGSPYAASVAATYALSRARDADPATGALVGAVLAGEQVAVLGFLDPGRAADAGAPKGRLNGRARLVAGAEDADWFLLVAPDGSGAVLVERAAGTIESVDGFDVSRSCGDLAFDDAPARVVDVPDEALSTAVLIHGLLLAGDALGGLETMHARTTTYARDRRAFGNVIGGFQAVQHRLVDHAVRIRGLSLLADDAAGQLAVGGRDADRQVLLAEAGVASRAVTILHDLLQLTGAIGFTWEYGLHLYERRAHLDARLGRDPRQALTALAQREGWSDV